MPQLKGATYFNLKGGLNTEASPLNIPPTDATAIENIDINIDGSIRRRRAFDFLGESVSGNLYRDSNITDYTNVTGGTLVAEVPSMTQFSPTDSLGNVVKHVVLHIGQEFLVYDYTNPRFLKEIDVPKQTLDQTAYSKEQAVYHTTFLQNAQRLYTVNKKHPLGYLGYTPSTDDFAWVRGDAQHRVDNGVDAAPATNIIDDDTGWGTSCLSNSRLWLAGSKGQPNTLFFSQTIINGDEYVKMYQEADPYDALDNLLVDTDGGSISLTGAEQILSIAPLGSGVIVFANNGIWSIAGQDSFRPTSYSINKISDVGIIGTNAWSAVEQQLVFFGRGNVYTILLGTSLDTPEVQPIGNKIVDFYNGIAIYNRESGKSVYDSSNKKLYFFCNFDSYSWMKTYSPYKQMTMVRDVLVFDVRLAAWSTYRMADNPDGDLVTISDAAVFDGGDIVIEDVTTIDGEVVTSGGLAVTAQDITATDRGTVLQTLLTKKDGNTWKIGLGRLKSTGLVDFEDSTEDAESNTSYITLAHQVFNDVNYKKSVPYIIPMFERVESNIYDAEGLDVTPGGCKYRIDWDWASNSNNAKFGTLRNAYFPYRFTTAHYGGVDPGIQVVSSKLKIRGRGEVFKLHFESDGDKDFKLYGWQLMLYTNTRTK